MPWDEEKALFSEIRIADKPLVVGSSRMPAGDDGGISSHRRTGNSPGVYSFRKADRRPTLPELRPAN